jgi:hypothetical protein
MIPTVNIWHVRAKIKGAGQHAALNFSKNAVQQNFRSMLILTDEFPVVRKCVAMA